MAIWDILWSFGTFFPFLVCCTEKNLATLAVTVASFGLVCVIGDAFKSIWMLSVDCRTDIFFFFYGPPPGRKS
jgi:hypothetical protein